MKPPHYVVLLQVANLRQRTRESLEKGVILAEDGEALFKNERYGKNVLLMRLSSLVDGSSVGLLVKPPV